MRQLYRYFQLHLPHRQRLCLGSLRISSVCPSKVTSPPWKAPIASSLDLGPILAFYILHSHVISSILLVSTTPPRHQREHRSPIRRNLTQSTHAAPKPQYLPHSRRLAMDQWRFLCLSHAMYLPLQGENIVWPGESYDIVKLMGSQIR